MPIGADRCGRADFWAVQVDLAEQDSISLYWREHLSSSGPPGRQRVPSLLATVNDYFCPLRSFLASFSSSPILTLCSRQVRCLFFSYLSKGPLQSLQTHLRGSGNSVHFEGINDAALITILVGVEVQDVILGVKSMRAAGASPHAPQALQLPQSGWCQGLPRWEPPRI